MWALKLFRDDFCRPDVNKGPRRHRHQDGVRQLPRELRDRDTEGQPFFFVGTSAVNGRESRGWRNGTDKKKEGSAPRDEAKQQGLSGLLDSGIFSVRACAPLVDCLVLGCFIPNLARAERRSNTWVAWRRCTVSSLGINYRSASALPL